MTVLVPIYFEQSARYTDFVVMDDFESKFSNDSLD